MQASLIGTLFPRYAAPAIDPIVQLIQDGFVSWETYEQQTVHPFSFYFDRISQHKETNLKVTRGFQSRVVKGFDKPVYVIDGVELYHRYLDKTLLHYKVIQRPDGHYALLGNAGKQRWLGIGIIDGVTIDITTRSYENTLTFPLVDQSCVLDRSVTYRFSDLFQRVSDKRELSSQVWLTSCDRRIKKFVEPGAFLREQLGQEMATGSYYFCLSETNKKGRRLLSAISNEEEGIKRNIGFIFNASLPVTKSHCASTKLAAIRSIRADIEAKVPARDRGFTCKTLLDYLVVEQGDQRSFADFSAGHGDIARMLRDVGVCDLTLIEPWERNVDALAQQGFANVIHGDALKLSRTLGLFDVIVSDLSRQPLSDVDCVKTMFAHLKKHGQLAVLVSESVFQRRTLDAKLLRVELIRCKALTKQLTDSVRLVYIGDYTPSDEG